MLQYLPMAIQTGMSIYDAVKPKKENTINLEDYYPSWTKSTGNALSNWVQQYLPQYQPGAAYQGQLSAGKTPFETQGQGILQNYLNQPATGGLFNQAQGQLSDTLSGKYMNPATSPYIQSMQKMAQGNLQDAISTARIGQGARGSFYGSRALGEEAKMTGDTQNYLNSIIGNFIQNERQNMLGAVPQAQSLEQYGNVTAPLQQVAASQSFGALDRTLEQSNLESQYKEWVRQRGEQGDVLGMAQTLMGGQPGSGGTMNTPIAQNSSLTNLLSNPQFMQMLQQLFGGGQSGANNITGFNSYSGGWAN